MQWLSTEFLIITIYYVHLACLENSEKIVQKFHSNVDSESSKFPQFAFLEKFWHYPVQRRYGNSRETLLLL